MPSPKPIGRWITILSRYQQMDLSRKLEAIGIGYGQHTLLLAVCKSPGIRQDALAEQLFLNKSSVARGVSQLEQNGYLSRRVDEADKRALLLYPTPKAEQAFDEVERQCALTSRRMTRGFDEAELDLLNSLLVRAVENVFDLRG